MSTQRKYDAERHESAVRMVFESREEGESLKTVCERVAPLVDVKFGTLYNWAKRARPVSSLVDRGVRVGDVEAENKALKRELREVKRANEILKAAATFFAGEESTVNQRGSSLCSV